MTQFAISPASDDDADSLCQFLNTCTLFHQGIARSSPTDILTRLHYEGSNPAFDSFVVREGEQIAGFAHLWPHGDDEIKLFARTHPDARGRGVGSRLLALCDQRAAELRPAARRTTTNWASDATAPDLLQLHGYRPIRHFVRMERTTDTLSDETLDWPADVDCVRLSDRPDHAGSLYNAWKDAFADEWSTGAESEREFWQERRESKLGSLFAFDPALWLLACDQQAVVGFCLCEIGSSADGTVGRISEIGIVRPHRGAGLGYALLQNGFRELQARGATRIVLDIDSENITDAQRLYEKAGMTSHPSFTIWEKAQAAI